MNALYQYAVERQLALPVGFVAKTVKAFLCLGADGRFLGLVPLARLPMSGAA